MFKMMKYEYRRGVFPLMIVVIALTAVELMFLGGIAFDKDVLCGLGITFLFIGAWIAYMFVLIYGVLSYSQDLKNKSGYMVFMTPVSSYKIIGAKLLSILLTGITLVAYIGLLFVVDYSLFCKKYEVVATYEELINGFLGTAAGTSLGTILINVVVFILVALLQFFTAIAMAYFAVTLSSTVLQNKKIKGVVSFILFVVLYVGMNVLAYKLPELGNGFKSETMLEAIYASLPQLILYVVCLVGGYFGSAILLEKKVSL